MRINVVTVFKSENCGSYLQAWALKEYLSSTGNDVRFCNYFVTDNTAESVRGALKCCLRLRLKRAVSILKKEWDYKKCRKTFETVDPKASCDLCFFGSDTIWNFNDSFFKNNASFFTGADVVAPCYSYSVSVGSTPKEVFTENESIIKNIQKFKKISVRDVHSEAVLSEFYPVDRIIKTVDPTMLLDKQVYLQKIMNGKCSLPRCLFVYYFGSISDEIWKALKEFSKKRNLKIVNVGFYEEKYDISVSFSPSNFISAFANAEYVFTNTFHGCVFSTIFNKQFSTDGIQKKKIEGFLEEFSLLDRVVKDASELEKIFTTPVDYDNVNKLMSEARKRSVDYLQSVIDEVKVNE